MKKDVYGYCPKCGAPGVMRERQPFGDDVCENGHQYPSKSALEEKPEPESEDDDP